MTNLLMRYTIPVEITELGSVSGVTILFQIPFCLHSPGSTDKSGAAKTVMI